jgi:hypothetical protein
MTAQVNLGGHVQDAVSLWHARSLAHPKSSSPPWEIWQSGHSFEQEQSTFSSLSYD